MPRADDVLNLVTIKENVVYVNGHPLKCVYGYEIEVDADNPPVGMMTVTFGFDYALSKL